MKKSVIGYVFSGDGLNKDEKTFLKVAKKKNIDLIMINTSKDVGLKELEEKINKCDIIYNSTAIEFAVEFKKTIEELGKKVIESSDAYYFSEDKWLFFVKCMENKIPTPETILLSDDLNVVKKEIKEFNHWPLVLKRVCGTMGEFVERANNIDNAVKIINNFWDKGNERLPIIAQEFIHSPSYRVTVIGDKVMQTAIKENKHWKATGVYAKKFKKFEVDNDLDKIIKKIIKVSKMKIFGIDLLKKENNWFVIEVNSEPALDFFEDEREKLIDGVLTLMKNSIKKYQDK